MRTIICSFIVYAAVISPHLIAAPSSFNQYFIDAAGKAKPSVVTIMIYDKLGNGKETNYQRVAYGAGTVISKNGYIVTNNHVLSKGNYYQVFNHDGARIQLQKFKNDALYLTDTKTDIAIMKIYNPENIEFQAIDFADPNDLSEGEWVLAIGNPFGLKQSITSGIVSSKGRDNIGFTDIEDFIQTDTPINPGNSGGPLINLNGKLVGINTAIRTDSGTFQGVSFAIPANIVRQVCSDLIKHGRVRRGWLGFIVKEKKDDSQHGDPSVEILSVIRRSPADMVGLQKNDIIKEIDGKKINSVGTLIKSIGKMPVGSKVNIIISRNGKLFNFDMALREKEDYQNIRKGLEKLFILYGFEIDENARTDEIIISYISPKSLLYGIKKGDIIISYNGIKISSLTNFINVFYRSKQRITTLLVSRESKFYKIDFAGNGSDFKQ